MLSFMQHSPCGVEEGLIVLEVLETSIVLEVADGFNAPEVVDGLHSPILEVVDGWLELDVAEGWIVHEVVGGSAAAVLVLLTTRHCCRLQFLSVLSSTGFDKSDGSTLVIPVSTSTL